MRQTRRAFAVAVVLAVAAVTFAGCGGAKPTLSKSDFIRQADAICGATTAKVDNLPAPGDDATPHETVAALEQALAVVEPAVKRLAALPAAPADRAVLEQNLIAPTNAQDLAAHMSISNVQEANGDAATEEAALTAFRAAAVDPDRAAHDKALADFGFAACARTNPAATPPFVAADAGFSAVFPIMPTRQTGLLRASRVILPIIGYRAVTPSENVSVGYFNLPAAPTSAGIQTIFDTGVENAASNLNGIVVSTRRIIYLGSPAEDDVIAAPGHVLYIRVVIIGPKVYVLEVVTATADTPHPGYHELLATFHAIGAFAAVT